MRWLAIVAALLALAACGPRDEATNEGSGADVASETEQTMRLTGSESVEELIDHLENAPTQTKIAALQVLAREGYRMPDLRIFDAMVKALQDPEMEVVMAAAQALVEYGDLEALTPLEDLATDPRLNAEQTRQVLDLIRELEEKNRPVEPPTDALPPGADPPEPIDPRDLPPLDPLPGPIPDPMPMPEPSIEPEPQPQPQKQPAPREEPPQKPALPPAAPPRQPHDNI